jgi:hypothetical protein
MQTEKNMNKNTNTNLNDEIEITRREALGFELSTPQAAMLTPHFQIPAMRAVLTPRPMAKSSRQAYSGRDGSGRLHR